ncbi:DNA-binding pseudobarrel domain protein [Raphanus sativus]|nr:DNA-binding pseudobarrel domain protein [Raphanus sativus]
MAGTELFPDAPFDPKSERNIFITLTESDIGLSNTITMSKELLEANVFMYLPSKDITGLIQHNEPTLLDVFDYDTKITTTLTIRKNGDKSFKFHGWSMILQSKQFKKEDHFVATEIRVSAARSVVESALSEEVLAIHEALKSASMAALRLRIRSIKRFWMTLNDMKRGGFYMEEETYNTVYGLLSKEESSKSDAAALAHFHERMLKENTGVAGDETSSVRYWVGTSSSGYRHSTVTYNAVWRVLARPGSVAELRSVVDEMKETSGHEVDLDTY